MQEEHIRYTPGQIYSAWRTAATTGGIEKADIYAAMDTIEVPVIRLQQAKRRHALKRIELERVTGPIQPAPARVTGPCLPLDRQGRPYLKIVNPFETTIDLVEVAINRFHNLTNAYPSVILLSALRFLTAGTLKHFYPRDVHAKRIPYQCEQDCTYDVLVR